MTFDWGLPMLGAAIVSLIGIIYGFQTARIRNLESWKNGRPSTTEILTKAEHFTQCNAAKNETKVEMLRLFEQLDGKMEVSISSVKDHVDHKVENVILKAINDLKR